MVSAPIEAVCGVITRPWKSDVRSRVESSPNIFSFTFVEIRTVGPAEALPARNYTGNWIPEFLYGKFVVLEGNPQNRVK